MSEKFQLLLFLWFLAISFYAKDFFVLPRWLFFLIIIIFSDYYYFSDYSGYFSARHIVIKVHLQTFLDSSWLFNVRARALRLHVRRS